VVSINNVRFRVLVTDRELTIEWLCGDVAARYERHLISLGHKLSPKSISQGQGGGGHRRQRCPQEAYDRARQFCTRCRRGRVGALRIEKRRWPTARQLPTMVPLTWQPHAVRTSRRQFRMRACRAPGESTL